MKLIGNLAVQQVFFRCSIPKPRVIWKADIEFRLFLFFHIYNVLLCHLYRGSFRVATNLFPKQNGGFKGGFRVTLSKQYLIYVHLFVK